MKAGIKTANVSPVDGEWTPVSVTFGAVTVKTAQPPEHVRRANIEAGQAALRRGLSALLKPGIKLERQKGGPLFFGCEDRPGWMIRELDGQKTLGRFIRGRFVAEKAHTPAQKRAAKS